MHKQLSWSLDSEYSRYYYVAETNSRVANIKIRSDNWFVVTFNNIFTASDYDGSVYRTMEEAHECVVYSYTETLEILFEEFFDKSKVVATLRKDRINNILETESDQDE